MHYQYRLLMLLGTLAASAVLHAEHKTSLYKAAQAGDYDKVIASLERHKDDPKPESEEDLYVNQAYQGITPLLAICYRAYAYDRAPEIIAVLIEHGANLKSTPHGKETPLHAIILGLIPNHIGINQQQAQERCVRAITILLKESQLEHMLCNSRDEADFTPLDLALKYRFGSIAIILDCFTLGANRLAIDKEKLREEFLYIIDELELCVELLNKRY